MTECYRNKKPRCKVGWDGVNRQNSVIIPEITPIASTSTSLTNDHKPWYLLFNQRITAKEPQRQSTARFLSDSRHPVRGPACVRAVVPRLGSRKQQGSRERARALPNQRVIGRGKKEPPGFLLGLNSRGFSGEKTLMPRTLPVPSNLVGSLGLPTLIPCSSGCGMKPTGPCNGDVKALESACRRHTRIACTSDRQRRDNSVG
ncbi:hypothetical protein EDB89DRAFT_1984622 [Lactarius sanguifluus]|nr:hypothetical protein EDB89DRAFT_1984622 [Lactarius sanguifluus]